MTVKEYKQRVHAAFDKYTDFLNNDDVYEYIGVRFEDKLRFVGDLITDFSRSNIDREDAREFPEFGTVEYDSLPELDGVCAYQVHKDYFKQYGWDDICDYKNDDDELNLTDCIGGHCYILGADKIDYGEDSNEIIMSDAVVLDTLF